MHQPFYIYDPELLDEGDEALFPPEQEGITWEYIDEKAEAVKREAEALEREKDCPF